MLFRYIYERWGNLWILSADLKIETNIFRRICAATEKAVVTITVLILGSKRTSWSKHSSLLIDYLFNGSNYLFSKQHSICLYAITCTPYSCNVLVCILWSTFLKLLSRSINSSITYLSNIKWSHIFNQM